jgi:hypothetical protein
MKSQIVEINDWRLVYILDESQLDDVVVATYLAGSVPWHPTLVAPEGMKPPYRIETSVMVQVHGRVVHTEHTVYRLGEPSRQYLDFIERKGLRSTQKHPIPVCFYPKRLAECA